MRALPLVFAVLSSAACIVPVHRGLSMERTKVWAPPGAPMVFSWVSRVEHRTTDVLETTKDDLELNRDESDRSTRTTIYAVDLATHRETPLGEVTGEGGEALYYDAARGVLWVRDDKHMLSGLAGPGRPVGPAHGQRQILVNGLEPPFVLAPTPAYDADAVALYDLAADGRVILPASVIHADVTIDGAVVRFTSLVRAGDSVQVRQIAVDWSSGAPQRLPDVEWTTAPLSPADGTRLAVAMLRDGHRYAEVVRGPTGTHLLVYDLVTSAPPVVIALPSPPPDAPPSGAPGVEAPPAALVAHLATLDDDAVVFGEGAAAGERMCWRGAAVRVNRALVVPLPDAPCVLETSDAAGHRVLATKENDVAIVDAEARLVRLDGVNRYLLAAGLATGPTSRAFKRGDEAALVVVDLATGEQRSHWLAGVAPKDRLIGVGDGVARLARGGDTILTVPLTLNPVPTTLVLAAPAMTRADRMPRDRTELWIGGGGGASTRATGAGRMSLEVAHWVTDRWTAVGRANARFESASSMTEPTYFDAGASFGYAWHRLPRLWSLAFEADLGANYAATYVGKQRTGQAFAPSAEVHIGAQGSLVGLDVSVLVPSLIDLDRGVQFLLNLKFGFTENLR